jgi:hypothetical protein
VRTIPERLGPAGSIRQPSGSATVALLTALAPSDAHVTVTLNQFAYPREDDRGQQDGAWLSSAIERAEAELASIRFDRPGE